jgi:hypothetical protein
MNKQANILEAAQTLRQLFGCAYGECYHACILLVSLLKKAGFKAKIIKGTFLTDLPPDYLESLVTDEDREIGGKAIHFWVVCDGYLLDITADQFNDEIEGETMGEIVFVPLNEKKSRYPRYSVGKTVSLTKNPCSTLKALSIIQRMPEKETKETLKEIGLI